MKKRIAGFCLAALVFACIALRPANAEEQEDASGTQIASSSADLTQQNIQLASVGIPRAAPSSSEQDDRADELRLDLARVDLFAETGSFDRAFALIGQLKEKYPGNARVLAAEADLNARIGNANSAFVGLNKALLLDPSDEDLLEQHRAATTSQGPSVLGGFTFRRTNEAFEQLSRASAQAAIAPTLGAMIDLENDHLHSRTPVVRADGAHRDFRGDEQRGALMLNKVLENNDEANASIYTNTESAGVGLRYDWWTHSGVTKIGGEYNRPDWDYVETVIGQGTKSDVRLERKQIFTNDFNATLGGGYNLYALHDHPDVANSYAWDANVTYAIPYNLFGDPENEINFSAAYTADAEYFAFVDKRGPASARYEPLPASDHEIHAINVSARKQVSSQFAIEGYGGYSVNRMDGSNGPLYGGSLVYSLSNRLALTFRAAHTDSGGENNSSKEDQLGVTVKWMM